MSSQPYHKQWEHLFAQKQHDFLESDCRHALDISNLIDLQVALQDLASKYQAGTFPDLISRLNPGIEHVRSFAQAISSASQSNARATLVWGAIQAVLEAAFQNNYAVEEMLDAVAQLNESLPNLDIYEDLLRSNQVLQFKLQHIYETHINYCIQSVQYMKKSSIRNFLTFFFYSSPQRNLQRVKALLMEQTKDFRSLVEDIISSQQHKGIQNVLSSQPLSQVPAKSVTDEPEDVQFPVTTVSLYRNYTFLGREDVLSRMHDQLSPATRPETSESGSSGRPTSKHGQQPRCCVLTGLGGIGKTQTALQYTYLYRSEYDAIFWVAAEQDHSLASTFSAIAETVQVARDLNDNDGQGQAMAAKRAMDWLKNTNRNWLIVFDNVEDIDDLTPYFPLEVQTKGAGIIITTQKQSVFAITDPAVTLIQQLASLDRNQGAELIFKYLQRDALDKDEDEKAKMTSELLEGLPLALATIGGYINQSGETVSDYYSSLKRSSKAWTTGAVGPAKQYEKTLATVFDTALKELPPNARCFINILAFLNPDSIPEQMFTQSIGTSDLAFISSKAELTDIIRVLRTRQLVRRDTVSGKRPFFSIHRTVQWSVLLDLSENYEHRWKVFQQAFDLIRSCLPKVSTIDNPEPEYWTQFEKFVPQILSLRSHCLWPEPPVELPRDFARVLSDMATYMWHAGLFGEGTEALLTAEDILNDNNIGKKDPLRGNVEQHLGIFASFNGVSERKFALERRERAIDARKAAHNQIPKTKMTRDDEIRRWNVESDMAYGYIQWEDFASAEITAEKCLEQYKKWGTEKDVPFEYVKYNQIISYVWMAKREPINAIAAAKKGAELAEVCAGLIHPTTQLLRTTLLNHLYLAGELDEALKEAEGILRARKEIHGEFNHYTLETYSFYASLLAEKGKYSEAESMYLKCLDRRKRSTWNQEGVARAQFLYGRTLEKMGHSEKAEKEMNAARATMEYFLQQYPEWLKRSEDGDEMVVFDQMVSLWAGRYTGKLKQV